MSEGPTEVTFFVGEWVSPVAFAARLEEVQQLQREFREGVEREEHEHLLGSFTREEILALRLPPLHAEENS